jgi:hypothetical protein
MYMGEAAEGSPPGTREDQQSCHTTEAQHLTLQQFGRSECSSIPGSMCSHPVVFHGMCSIGIDPPQRNSPTSQTFGKKDSYYFFYKQ